MSLQGSSTRGQRGQVAVFVIGMTLVVFAVVGVAVDGTRAFLYRRTLQNAADAAARSAAARIDTDHYYSGGRALAINSAEARRAAASTLGARRLQAHATVTTEDGSIRVVLSGEIGTTFLALAGIASLPVRVEAVAEPLEIP